MIEPVLTSEDHAVWDRWMRAASAHATTLAHRRRVDSSLEVVIRALSREPNACVMWSGGKDSTVMTHLVCVKAGARIAVVSEKDDLDYPGEEDYVREFGRAWNLDLSVVKPSQSPRAWVEARLGTMLAGDEIHARGSGLSKACFYPTMMEAGRPYRAVMLGLRSEESGARSWLRRTRGRLYVLADGTLRALPIADWSGLDVYAYALGHGIELLPVYRCLAFMHAEEPWTLRKSWWLPGSSARFGQIAWLRRYYPSLFRQLCAWMPEARMHC